VVVLHLLSRGYVDEVEKKEAAHYVLLHHLEKKGDGKTGRRKTE
tara:strand:+ start:426 stop:557 length:132 start_codon:yes stop_codon:yes gene_type:complete